MRGEEANGQTHLLSLLLLLHAIANMGAECDTKQPPPFEEERWGGEHKKEKASGHIYNVRE